jgi:hypothetical protein
LSDLTRARLARERPDLASARDLLELFALPGGAAWWKENGSDLYVEFLTDPQGPNVSALLGYFLSKKLANRPDLLSRPLTRLFMTAPGRWALVHAIR